MKSKAVKLICAGLVVSTIFFVVLALTGADKFIATATLAVCLGFAIVFHLTK